MDSNDCPGVRPGRNSGFTLVELMVATVILSVILMLTLSMVNSVGKITQSTRAKVETFQEARAGFEAMTRNLSQSILNTYWDYQYPSGNTALAPTDYIRQSELHFIAGPAQSGVSPNLLLDAGLQTATHAVFFLAPRGYSDGSAGRPLGNLLNAFGYYVEFGSDAGMRPPFLTSTIAPLRYRFRLMEMTQPSSQLSIYDDLAKFKTSNAALLLDNWFVGPLKLAARPTHALGENIIALVIEPMRSPNETVPVGAPATLAPNYVYDTRAYLRASPVVSADLAALSRNQIPAMLRVTVVALDEPSAARLQGASTSAPTIPVAGGKEMKDLFRDSSKYAEDLANLEQGLMDARLNYRVFTSSVSVLQSKWSE